MGVARTAMQHGRVRAIDPAVSVRRLVGVRLAAIAAFGFGLLVYVPTLLPGVAFGDWAEMQTAPLLLEIPHPTGFPLYILLGRLWLLVEPFGSVAWRMNLFAAVVVSAAAAVATLTAARLGARPVLALAGGMLLVVTGTVWDAATAAEVNALHLLLVSLLVFLAVRWRDQQSQRDILLGGLLAGLAVSNHLLALAADAVVVPLALWAGRQTLGPRPWLVPAAGALSLVGLAPYLFIPIRVALSGPTEYPALRTWSGIWDHISGVAYRRDMHVLSGDSVANVIRDLPGLAAYAVGEVGTVGIVALILAVVGLGVLVRRDRWAAALTVALLAITLDLFVGYRGDLPHYLLAGWLVVAIWAALGFEAIARLVARMWPSTRAPQPAHAPRFPLIPLALVVPLLAGLVNLPAHDRFADATAPRFVDTVLASLPPNAILFTYWDAGEALHYAECVEHRRPDVDVIAPDDWVSFRPCTGMTAELALRSGRPLYALAYAGRGLGSIAGRFTATPVTELAVPFGGLALDHETALLRLTPTG
jgi:transmembrane protein TMEM260 (protein O-mannosyltransferase)